MRAFLLLSGLLAFAAAASAQPQSAPAGGAPTRQQTRTRKSRGGRGRASSSEGPDLDAAATREIPCPPGFVAETADGPHLAPTKSREPRKRRKGREKKSADRGGGKGAAPNALARRCVPAAPAKKAGAGPKDAPGT